MLPIRAERQRLDPQGTGRIEAGVKMREQRATARGLPLDRLPESLAVEGGQQEAVLPGKMFGRRFTHLLRRREVDIAIGKVDRRAIEPATAHGIIPEVARQYLENHRHAGLPMCFWGASELAPVRWLRRTLVRDFALDNQHAPQDQPPIHLHQEYLPISMEFKGIYS